MVRIIKKAALEGAGGENGGNPAQDGGLGSIVPLTGSHGKESAYESKFFAILDKRLSELDSLADEIQADLLAVPVGGGDSRPRLLRMAVAINAMTLEILKQAREAETEGKVIKIIEEEFGKTGFGVEIVKR